ncbi:MAG TPA: response regulator [Polyangiaceae bacterium]|nr:response regulator [Polyangiaceae bacterium]HMR75442.1 response regulator [Polyangiaceae bacterium]
MGHKILLIDDEDDIRTIAEMSLGTVGGFEVVLAENGRRGVALALSEKPDAILLDVMMPGMDGPTTLANIRSKSEARGIPIIFMTAKIQAKEREAYLALGAAGVIPKPFDPMTLATDIKAILGWT